MKPATLFDYDDYKAFLKDQIAENKGIRGYQSHLADAAGCQRSFLSQVLNGPMDLGREHAAELCRFWNFDGLQSEYFLGLVDWARAGNRSLRELIRNRLARIKAESSNLKSRLKSDEIAGAEAQAIYYSSWYWSAIHLLVGLPKWNTPQAMAERLQLPLELVKAGLLKLEELGLIERAGSQWVIGKRDIHLPESSPLNEANHQNWRQRAVLNARHRDKEAVHYTSVFTMGQEDSLKLRELIREMILKSRETIAPSPNEEIFCFTCDFFLV